MKRILMALVCVGVLLVSAMVYAAEMKTMNHIPERYILMVITGSEPDQPLNKDAILALAKEQFEKANVAQFDYMIYDKGKKRGDGVRAYGQMRKSGQGNPFVEVTGDRAQIQGKFIENMLGGYETTPKVLHTAYSDNEVVADDDFKGKTVVMEIKVPQIAKDILGKPYIKIGVDKAGLTGAHITLKNDDPFLRRIKKGSEVYIRAIPTGFTMQSVMLDGIIITDGTAFLIDGKAVPQEDVFDKAKPASEDDKKKK